MISQGCEAAILFGQKYNFYSQSTNTSTFLNNLIVCFRLLTSLITAVNKSMSIGSIPESMLLSIASNLLTIDTQFYGNAPVLQSQNQLLLRNLFPGDTAFFNKKVKW